MANKPRYFLSYARQDAALAHRLAEGMTVAGVAVFDPLRDIGPGEDWRAAIDAALKKADGAVFLVTPNARDSSQSLFESGWAYGRWSRDRAFRVIPVLAKDASPRDIPNPLIDFRGIQLGDTPDVDQSISHLVEALNG